MNLEDKQSVILNAMFPDQTNPDNILHEVKCISLIDYCRKYGMNERTCRRHLANGTLIGKKAGGEWFVAEGNTNGLYFLSLPIPQGYVPLASYCKRNKIDQRNTRRKLAAGQLEGVKINNSWFVPRDLPHTERKKKDEQASA